MTPGTMRAGVQSAFTSTMRLGLQLFGEIATAHW